MPGVKSVILAGTINLENYENFRFEFAGEVDQPADVMKQAEFSASCLLGLANSADPVTGQKIRGYVARVFGVREEAFQKGPKKEDPAIYESKPVPSTPAKDTSTEAVSRQQHADKLMADLSRLQADHNTRVAASKPVAVQTPAVTLNQVSPLPARMPAPAVPPAKPAAPTVATCEKCGEGVTESMKKMSQLFASKTLCKKCLDGGAS